MSAKRNPIRKNWIDPDDAPELTPELARRAQFSIGGKVIREATGTLTKRGRPPVGDEPKQQVTLRLAPKVVRYFKQSGDGWQTRLNETLEQYVSKSMSGAGKSTKPAGTSALARRIAKKKADSGSSPG